MPDETSALVALGEATGIFEPGETDELLRRTLELAHAGELAPGHQVRVLADSTGGRPLGWVFFGPRDANTSAWELFWIGVDPLHHGKGVGSELLRFVEAEASAAGAEALFIETSSSHRLERARRFYLRHGYTLDGVQPDEFGPGDDKLTFRRALTPVERARAADLDVVGALLVAQLAEHGVSLDARRAQEALAGLIHEPARGAVLAARDGSATIGFAVLATTWTVEHGGLVAWLDELYVVPPRRGAGVGQALLTRALAEARALGCRAVELEVDHEHARAEHLYGRNGFEPLSRARWVRSLVGP